MKIKTTIFILISFASSLYTQSYKHVAEIGNFNSASAFSITPAGNIYVTDSGTNEIFKLDTLGNVLNYIGGFGWDPSAFDNPTDVYSNTLQSFVADENNNRIQVFDKNLNFLYEFSTKEIDDPNGGFNYPVSAATSTQGDLYVLDSDNQRILKFDLSGNFVLEIGNYDAGAFSLEDPKRLALSQSELLFVADKNQLVVFDRFGTGIKKIPLPFDPENLNILFGNLTVNSSGSVYQLKLNSTGSALNKIKLEEDFSAPIIEASIFNNKLYILTEKNIHIFTK